MQMFDTNSFQEPFNKVTYALIGDDSATNYFQINAESGAISVSNNLENDGTRTYSVSILSGRNFMNMIEKSI